MDIFNGDIGLYAIIVIRILIDAYFYYECTEVDTIFCYIDVFSRK